MNPARETAMMNLKDDERIAVEFRIGQAWGRCASVYMTPRDAAHQAEVAKQSGAVQIRFVIVKNDGQGGWLPPIDK